MSETNKHGNSILRESLDADRYLFDFKLCKADKGWEQYDTSQDAWYFGVWVNKAKKQIATYAEGDFSLVTCPTVESFNAEIADMNEFYDEGFVALTIDANGTTAYRQDRQQFFI